MNARQASLPDLLAQKRRGSVASLSEGIAAARPSSAFLGASKQVAPRPASASRPRSALQYLRRLATNSGSVQTVGSAWRQSVLPEEGESCGPVDVTGRTGIPQSLVCECLRYYRARQTLIDTHKNGRRAPQHLEVECRQLESALASHLRPMHPTFLARFDQNQLERLLRAMPFMRLTEGRWIFGDESLEASWPAAKGGRAFLLLGGSVSTWQSSVGQGTKTDFNRVAVFTERPFFYGDDHLEDYVAGCARAREASLVGVLSLDMLETAFSDRFMGNRRIAQVAQQLPTFHQILAPEAQMDEKPSGHLEVTDRCHVGLQELSKVASPVYLGIGQELLLKEMLEDCLLIVAKGSIGIRGDVRLTENLAALPPKKVRLRMFVEKATDLKGDSIFDRLDPYCLVKLGDHHKRQQTPVIWNAGVNVQWDYPGAFVYADEEELQFFVYDRDEYSADDLCGECTLRCADIPDQGCSLRLTLERTKTGLFSDESKREVAGTLHVSFEWETVPMSTTMQPKVEEYTDQELFHLGAKECWGHEQLIFGDLFLRTLEKCGSELKYSPELLNLRIVGAFTKGQTGDNMVCLWKVTRDHFNNFVKTCNREKAFTNACRDSMLRKQSALKQKMMALIQKAQDKAERDRIMLGQLETVQEVVLDPQEFRRTHAGQRCHVTVRNAVGLSGGSFFDKLDPYAVLRFRGARQEMRTSVLQDAGSDPMWNCEGDLWYNGETHLTVAVYDYETSGSDQLLATGQLTVESFMSGFEGMVGLQVPEGKNRASHKPMQICISVWWDPLPLTDLSQPSQPTPHSLSHSQPSRARRPSRHSLRRMAESGR